MTGSPQTPQTRIADFSNRFFCENFEIAAVQKDANLVELEKCCQTHIQGYTVTGVQG